MFPNPQDALPLPLRPNPERYKRLAKDLVKACKSADPNAFGDWAEAWVKTLVKQSGLKLGRKEPSRNPALDRTGRSICSTQVTEWSTVPTSKAQSVIAGSHGFESWNRFTKHLDDLSNKSSVVAKFEAVADTICNGDVKTLKRLLREEPRLIHSRSTREHKATLLHYVSANGVEGLSSEDAEKHS